MSPSQEIPALDALPEHCWRRLTRAVDDRSDPWRTPAVGTRSETGASLRTVVLRSVSSDLRELLLHTDARSTKAGELDRTPWLSWLFWDPNDQEQLRCEGAVTLHREDALAASQWRDLPAHSRANYRMPDTPGTPLDEATARTPRMDDDDSAFTRFLVVRCQVETLDWLLLDRRGHRRARMSWSAPRWHADWVAP